LIRSRVIVLNNFVDFRLSATAPVPPSQSTAQSRFRISLLSDEPSLSSQPLTITTPSIPPSTQLSVALLVPESSVMNHDIAVATFNTSHVVSTQLSGSQASSASTSTHTSPGQKRKEIEILDSQPAAKQARSSSEYQEFLECADNDQDAQKTSSAAALLKKKLEIAKPRPLPPKLEDQRRLKAEELQRKQLEAEKRRKKIEEEEKKKHAEKLESKKRKEENARLQKTEEEAAKRARLEERKIAAHVAVQKSLQTDAQSKTMPVPVAICTQLPASSSPTHPLKAVIPSITSKPKQTIPLANPILAPSTALVLTSASLAGSSAQSSQSVDRLMSPPPSRPPKAASPPRANVVAPANPGAQRRRGPVNTPDADNYEMSDHQDSDWDDEDSNDSKKPVIFFFFFFFFSYFVFVSFTD
jgi:hypothetical protein